MLFCRTRQYQSKQGCAELNGWAGIRQNAAGPRSPSGQVTGRAQPHTGTAAQAVTKPTRSARGLAAGQRSSHRHAHHSSSQAVLLLWQLLQLVLLEDSLPFCPALSFPWVPHCCAARSATRRTANPRPAFAAVRDRCPRSSHGLTPWRKRLASGRSSPPHSVSGEAMQDAKPEKQCGTWRRAEGREIIPPESEVSWTQFASALACRNNKPQSTPALIPVPSEDIAKENVHRTLQELKGVFKSCKQLGQVASPRGQFWPKAGEVYLNRRGRDTLMKQGCLLVLGDVLFASWNSQAPSGRGRVRTQDFPPSASGS